MDAEDIALHAELYADPANRFTGVNKKANKNRASANRDRNQLAIAFSFNVSFRLLLLLF